MKNVPTFNSDELILNYDVYQHEKIEKLKAKHEKKIEYSFKPSIDKNSDRIATQKFLNNVQNLDLTQDEIKNKRINDLYLLSKKSEFKIKELEHEIYGEYNYKPLINKNLQINNNFDERQIMFNKRKIENQQR
jgi:hypothetical protein